MVRAFTAIDTATGMPDGVCQRVREANGVVDARVVAGDFDVIVELVGDDPHDVLTTVTGSIQSLEGVGTTRTYICID